MNNVFDDIKTIMEPDYNLTIPNECVPEIELGPIGTCMYQELELQSP